MTDREIHVVRTTEDLREANRTIAQLQFALRIAQARVDRLEAELAEYRSEAA